MQQMLQRQRELFVELDRVRGEMKSPSSAAGQLPTSSNDEAAQGTFSSDANEQAAYQNAVDLILKSVTTQVRLPLSRSFRLTTLIRPSLLMLTTG